MNPYTVKVACSVCGEEGVAHARERGYLYTHEFRHSDPQICANVLKEKFNKLNKPKPAEK